MIGQASSHCRGACYPTPSMSRNPKGQAQTVMGGAEIVDGSQQHHAVMQRGLPMGQMACATCEASEPLSEGGVEPFDVGGVDDRPTV